MSFRARLSLTWLESRENPSTPTADPYPSGPPENDLPPIPDDTPGTTAPPAADEPPTYYDGLPEIPPDDTFPLYPLT